VAHKELFEVVTAQDPFLLGLIGWIIAKREKVALQLQVHTDMASPSYAKAGWGNYARAHLAAFLLPRAHGIRVVSLRLRQALERTRSIAVPITILPIFTDVAAIKHAHRLDLHGQYPQYTHFLLVAARLEKEKRVDEIISVMPEVLKAFPKACLLLAGDGSERGELEALARNLGVADSVIFLGRRDDIFSLYKSVDVVVAATAPYEGYGATTVEALVAKAPVVSYDVGVAAHAGATIVLHGKLGETIVKTLRAPHKGALLGELPTAEEWAAAWKRSIDVCLNNYQRTANDLP
ncbi:MAG TPA: glycosyltransferase, partial [Candidatus Paceibacterota bacterium]